MRQKQTLDAAQEAYIAASRALKKQLTKGERLVKAQRYWEAEQLLCSLDNGPLSEALWTASGGVIAQRYDEKCEAED